MATVSGVGRCGSHACLLFVLFQIFFHCLVHDVFQRHVLLSVAHNSYAFLLLSHTYFMCFFYIHFLLLIFRYMLSAVLSYFMPTIKRPDHRAFYSYHKLAGTTFPIYLLPFLPQSYSYRISCSMTMPDWNCISSFSLDSTLMVEIIRLTRSLSNSCIWQVLVLK